jgi:hypothetical protein
MGSNYFMWFLFSFYNTNISYYKIIIHKKSKYILSVNIQITVYDNRLKYRSYSLYCFPFALSFALAGLIHKSKADRTEGNKTRGGAAPPPVLQTTYDRIEQTSINCKFLREKMPDYLLEETK